MAAVCFYNLRRLRQIRRRVGSEVTIRLVLALIMSRIDYCNSALAGLPQSTTALVYCNECRTQQLDWYSNSDRRSMLLQAFSSSTGYQSLAGPVQDMLLNALDPSWQLSGVSEEHRPICCCQLFQPTTRCRAYGPSSASVLSHTPVRLRGTHCLKTSVPHRTLQFL